MHNNIQINAKFDRQRYSDLPISMDQINSYQNLMEFLKHPKASEEMERDVSLRCET